MALPPPEKAGTVYLSSSPTNSKLRFCSVPLNVPYRGSYWPDLLSGQVQVAFPPMPSATGYIQAGTLRALAVTGATRSEALPNIPTVGEFVPGYEAIGWYGLGAPRDTPAPIIDKLNNEINTVLADPVIKTRLLALGAEPMPMTSAAFGKFMSDETDKWGKVIKFAGIKPD
jgi:tripartite-type tricarboxylate transporter receptor subunit TctC